MAYTKKFREEVMKQIDEGKTISGTARQFSIGTTTIKEWKRLREETGTLEKRPLDRKFKKIDPEKLKEVVEEKPDSYQREMADQFKCSQNAISKALNKMGISRKKN